jgi:hypothetical protein
MKKNLLFILSSPDPVVTRAFTNVNHMNRVASRPDLGLTGIAVYCLQGNFHCGEMMLERSFYTRMKAKLQPSVDHVALVKDGKPKPKDIMNAAANIDSLMASNKQAYRAIDRHRAQESSNNTQEASNS